MERDDEAPTRDSLFGQAVTLDEMETEQEGDKDKGKKGGDTVAEGDDIPEEYRGKSLKDIIAIANTAREGIRTATSAAEAARAAAELSSQNRQAPAPVADEPKELSREEIKALYDEDPLKAIEVIEQQAARRIESHIESRLAPLTAGTMGSAENWARQEFPDEFELFEKDIKALVNNVPNKAVFTTKEGWQDAIAYVRGKGGNFEKLVDHRVEKKNAVERDTSRGRERDRVGFSGRSTNAGNTRAPSSDKNIADRMSEEQRTIAQSFIDNGTFKNFGEYMDWYNKGG
jgi:hypothetical protein